jgi:PadR family transcriptional regulator, regulatory protein PadR
MIRNQTGELVQGTLDMMVLKILSRQPMHGYAVAVAIHERSREVLRVEEGSLYPALHRLELAGLLKSEWKLSEANRRAKFYRLTPAGRKELALQTTKWDRLAAAIARVMETA